MNIVALILRAFDATRIGHLAAALGIGEDALRKALAATVPTIVAGLAGLASRPGGARQLFDALNARDPQIVTKLDASIDAAEVGLLSDTGLEALSMLLGGAQENAISRAIGRFAALNEKQSVALAGLLSTGVLALLAQVQKSRALDVHGLASLMNAQRDNISAALPPGFANLLSGTPLLDTLGTKLASRPPRAAQGGRNITIAWLAMAPLCFLAGYLLATLIEKTATPATDEGRARRAASLAIAPSYNLGAAALSGAMKKAPCGASSKLETPTGDVISA